MNTGITLFCFPYAGGSAYSYRPLEAHLPPGVTLVGVELPGRGRRTNEPLRYDLEQLADDVFAQVREKTHAGAYALFGHSMGAALSYLCAQRIRRAGLPLPQALILSGKAAPSVPEDKTRHLLPRDEFVTMLRDLGGCPPEILAEEELIDYFEPILRADFEAVETWRSAHQSALPVPFVVLRGRDDEVERDEAEAWARETTSDCELHEFDGDHFFIQQHWHRIAELIARRLGACRRTYLAALRARWVSA